MDLKGAAEYKSDEPRSGFWSITRVIVWLIIPGFISGFIFLSNPLCDHGIPQARAAAANQWISQLSQSVIQYELDRGSYPSGDGKGSSSLVNALKTPGAKKLPYMDLQPEMIDDSGNLRSTLGDDKIVSYRCPGLHNPKSFDLWCEDTKGRVDGINNWEK